MATLKEEQQEKLLLAKELIEQRKLGDAWFIINEILESDPNHVPALIAATACLEKDRRFSTAYQCAARAVYLAPNISATWRNFGRCSEQLYQYAEAKNAYIKAIQLSKKPSHLYESYVNMSALMTMYGKWVDGEAYARKALEIQPDGKKALGNLGLACLGQQKWAEGWTNYDAILGSEYRKLIKYADEPLWDGKPGQSIIVYGEQGLGDELSFASMIPDALAICKKVVIDCDARLAPMFKRAFPKAVVYGTRWEKGSNWDLEWEEEDKIFDASIAIGQLGRYFRLKNEDFPGTPYLVPDQERYIMWREYFKTKKKPIIGIAWSGGVQWTAAQFRRWSLDEIRPLIESVDAHWVCLQYKDAEDEIARSGLPIHQYKFATCGQDYDDTAALVAACDLVICMQTSVGHLAGALGIETWCFVSPLSQWRYGGDSEKMLWYNAMKVWHAKNWKWPIDEACRVLQLRYNRELKIA